MAPISAAIADLATLVATGAHDLHGPYLTVPGLLRETSTGAIAGLVAPRPQLICVGAGRPADAARGGGTCLRGDRGGLSRRRVPARALEPLVEPGVGHRETLLMRQRTLAFLREHLQAPGGTPSLRRRPSSPKTCSGMPSKASRTSSPAARRCWPAITASIFCPPPRHGRRSRSPAPRPAAPWQGCRRAIPERHVLRPHADGEAPARARPRRRQRHRDPVCRRSIATSAPPSDGRRRCRQGSSCAARR